MKTGLITLSFLAIVSSCIVREDTDVPKLSPLNYLDHDHVRLMNSPEEIAQEKGLPLLVPMFKVINVPVQIEGTLCYRHGNGACVPLRFVELSLIQGEQKFVKASSDEQGKFLLEATIPAGAYKIVVKTKEFQGEKVVDVFDYKIRTDVEATPIVDREIEAGKQVSK